MPCQRCGTQVAPGSAFCPNCGQAQVLTSPAPVTSPTPVANPPLTACARCGATVPAGSPVCTTCGTPAGAPVPAGATGPPAGDGRSGLIIAAMVGLGLVLVALIVVFAVILIGRDSGTITATDSTTTSVTSTSTSSSVTSTTLASTTTTAPTTTIDAAQQQAAANLRAAMVDLDGIVAQSSQGRGQVGTVVAGVKACTINPEEASRQINNVIANRQSVLNQVNALNTRANSQVASLQSQLRTAIQASIDADVHYRDWMVYLYTDYYYTIPVGCPSGSAPTNASYDAGNSASSQATNAKRAFVAAYNPLAQNQGLRTWSDTEI
jgi:RNA polymerase subunit RPABC4/transcription elongation factor Spt4